MLAHSREITFFYLSALSRSTGISLHSLSPDEPTCYAIGMNNFVREPNGLAPVLISALSTDKGVVGQLYVSHPDVNESMRRRRQTSPFEVDGAIDKICFQGGECSCAEANCGVKCNQCKGMDTQKILAADDAMACNLQVSGKPYWYNTSLVTTSNYIVVPLSDMLTTPPKNITLWIRACNWRCHGDGDIEKYFAEDQWFILLGNKHASVVDSQQRRHYILNNSDYFDKAEANCDSAVANITRARKCHFA
uniref:Peptidase M12A domain-containing protein n=1 Tax=Steinernema glaseri TaxID=37863 RepID=A0A1I7XVS7_9BILA